MKKILFSLAILMAGCLTLLIPAYPVSAATASVTINKRVSVPTTGTTQQTAPLAGAQYRLTRIVAATPGVAIDPAQPATYREPEAQQLSVVLTTDQSGKATYAEADLRFGIYLLTELASAQITTPAAPVVFALTADAPAFTYAPKSGLTDLNSSAQPQQNHAATEAKIMQTSGQLPAFPGRVAAILAAGLLALTALLARWLRKKVRLNAPN